MDDISYTIPDLIDRVKTYAVASVLGMVVAATCFGLGAAI